MKEESVLDEFYAMRGYLDGDCGCCEHSGDCEFYANLSFPEHTTDCRWEFSRALVKEQSQQRKRSAVCQNGDI